MSCTARLVCLPLPKENALDNTVARSRVLKALITPPRRTLGVIRASCRRCGQRFQSPVQVLGHTEERPECAACRFYIPAKDAQGTGTSTIAGHHRPRTSSRTSLESLCGNDAHRQDTLRRRPSSGRPPLRKDGTRISVEFTIVPVRDEKDGMVGIAAILRGVTQRFGEMKALRQRLVQLESEHGYASRHA